MNFKLALKVDTISNWKSRKDKEAMSAPQHKPKIRTISIL